LDQAEQNGQLLSTEQNKQVCILLSESVKLARLPARPAKVRTLANDSEMLQDD